MTHQEFTNGELFNMQAPLRELGKIDVPAKVGIRIARLVRALTHEIAPIIETRNKLIIKYGEQDKERGQFINAQSPHWTEFAEENTALMEQTTKVEFEKVVLPDDARVAVDVLVALEPFLAVADIPMTSSNGTEKSTQIPVAKTSRD